MKDKSVIIIWVTIIALVGGIYFYFTQIANNNSQDTVEEEEISERDLVIKELAGKYQALIANEISFDYTVEAQQQLISDKPVIFEGSVDDIFAREEKIFVIFDAWRNDFVLELECSQQVINKFFDLEETANSEDSVLFNYYAIVANINEVTKPVLRLEGSVISEDEAVVEMEMSDTLIAKGNCLDIAVTDSF